MTKEKSYMIGKKNESEVDFPSHDIWIGGAGNFCLMLNEKQLEDLHNKIHILLENNRKHTLHTLV